MSRAIVFLAITLLSRVASADWAADIKVQVDKEVAQNFKNQSQVGLVLGILRGNESQVWAYGELAHNTAARVRGDSFFEIGSITKTFVGTLLALEANRGRVKLNDTVASLWPELAGTDAGRITLEQLATHTSGLMRDPSNVTVVDPNNPMAGYDEAKLLENLKAHKGSAPQYFSYSNLGLGLLGHLLATKLNGLAFDVYLTKNLTVPLGLGDVRLQVAGADKKRQASAHDEFLRALPPINLGVLDPAGTLKATANAMLAYAKFNLRDTNDELGRAAALAREPRAQVNNDARIGLTWFNYDVGGRKLVGHDGATFGHRAILLLEPATKSAVVMLVNTANSPSCVWTAVVGLPCQLKQWAKANTSVQKSLTGEYYSQILKLGASVKLINGFLSGELQGQRPFRLWPVSDYEYALQVVEAKVVFERAVTDLGDRFVLHQNGAKYEFVRSGDLAPYKSLRKAVSAPASPLGDEPARLFE